MAQAREEAPNQERSAEHLTMTRNVSAARGERSHYARTRGWILAHANTCSVKAK